MFATASFRSRKSQSRVVAPSTAVMRLHDKDWVFRKNGAQEFRRVEVRAGAAGADGTQQILTGVIAGDELIANALEFSTSVAEQGK
jgi:cobalt-zinc-cadmium efflux system membrane fusion protein